MPCPGHASDPEPGGCPAPPRGYRPLPCLPMGAATLGRGPLGLRGRQLSRPSPPAVSPTICTHLTSTPQPRLLLPLIPPNTNSPRRSNQTPHSTPVAAALPALPPCQQNDVCLCVCLFHASLARFVPSVCVCTVARVTAPPPRPLPTPPARRPLAPTPPIPPSVHLPALIVPLASGFLPQGSAHAPCYAQPAASHSPPPSPLPAWLPPTPPHPPFD